MKRRCFDHISNHSNQNFAQYNHVLFVIYIVDISLGAFKKSFKDQQLI